jgi:Glycosyltransferases, probably involved in cell wall biogenesis
MVSVIVVGDERSQPARDRVAALASDLRPIEKGTELLIAGRDPAALISAARSAAAPLVVIWEPNARPLRAEQLDVVCRGLPDDGWEVASVTAGRTQHELLTSSGLFGNPNGGLLIFRQEVAADVFSRLPTTESPLVAALMVARGRGYRHTPLSVAALAVGPRLAARQLRSRIEAACRRSELNELAEDPEMRAWRKETRRRRRTLRWLIVLDVCALGWWLDWLLTVSHAASVPLYLLLVLAQAVNIFQVLGYWHAVWRLREASRRPGDVEGEVDVFITTYDEPIEVVEPTLAAAVAMRRPHRTYLLDDGRRSQMAQLAARYGVTWLTRPDNRGHKAGNLNEALKRTKGDFFAVFDADHVPAPEFLERLLPWFRDTDMGWVQAPQYYANRDASYTAEGAMDQQAIFFGPVCEGMDGRDGVICCGTNFVMRRAALDEVGGFAEDSVTEDAATGLELHARGWRSRYVNETLAEGLAPEDLDAFLKQQRRWAQGNLEMLVRRLGRLPHLPPSLRLQYAWAASNYLSGISTIVYITLPCLYLLFGVQTVKTATSDDFIAHFAPFITLTVLIFVRSLDGRLKLRAVQFSYGLFPVHLQALTAAVFGRRIAFAVTPKLARGASAYHLIQPQLAAIAVSVISIAWGLHRQMDASTVTNACWALFNISMLAGVVRAAAGQRRPASIPVSARGTT